MTKKGKKRYGRLPSGMQDEMDREHQGLPQRSQKQSQVPPDDNAPASTSTSAPITLDAKGRNNREKGWADLVEVQEAASHDSSANRPNYHDVMDDQQRPTPQASISSVLHNPPPKSPRHIGGLFGGTSGNVVIKGGTFHNTYGHHTNVTVQLGQVPLEEQNNGHMPPPLPSLLINDNPAPPHTQDSHHDHIPPMHTHEQGLPLPGPNVASLPVPEIDGLQFPLMTIPGQNNSTSTIGCSPPDKSNKIYERHLELKQRGFPLWIPEPNRTLPMPYRRKGVDIGDVGIITPSGAFSFLFNICLPPDHPINPSTLPDGFAPIHPPIDPRDIREYLEFKPEGYLASTAIEKIHNNPPFRGLSFMTSSAEGALLTLPDGAIARDLENIRRFRKYAEANIESWYRYINGPRGREAKNGEVRLVTGCDKASSWGMAAVANVAQKVHHLKYYSTEDVAATGPIPLYKWEHAGFAEARVGPDLQEIEDLRRGDDSNATKGGKYMNQCLFVRTLNITLSDDAFAKINQNLESPSQPFQRGRGSSSSTCSPPNSGVQTDNTSQRSATNLAPQAEFICESPTENIAGGYVMTEYMNMSRSTISSTSHPADSLNKLLLQKVPQSRVVITQDEDWYSIISEDNRDEVMSNPSQIAERVLAANHIMIEHGIVFLEPKTERQSVLRQPQTTLGQSVKDRSESLSLSGSTSFAPSESESTSTPELRISIDTTNLSLAGYLSPILLDESELFKNVNPQDIIIAVMGPSGTGKSSFINMLLGSEVAVTSGGLLSCTQEVRAFGCLHPRQGRSDQKIIIVDTPGFDDTQRTDYEVLEEIAKWLESTYSKRIKLSGLLHFHSIRDSRMRRTPQRNLGMFQRLCGPKALKNVVLLTTFWDELEDQSVGWAREKQLSELFWKPLIDKGSRTERFDPLTYERAWEIVDRFPPAGIPLAIQVEMVDEHKKLWETSVFKFLVQWWTQLVNAIRGFTKDASQVDSERNHALRQKDALLRTMPASASSLSLRSLPSPSIISSLELSPKWFQARRKKNQDNFI